MKKKISLILLAFVMLASACLATSCSLKKPEGGKAETVYFLKDGKTEYSVVYSKDAAGHYERATEIFSSIIVDYEAEPPLRYEYTEKTNDKEIVIGDTNRQISKDLKAAVADKSKGQEGVWYAYGYKDGKLGFYANSADAMKLAWKTFYELIMKKTTIECQSDLWVVGGMNAAEYEAYLQEIADQIAAEEAAKRKEQIALIREKIASVTSASLDLGAMPSFVDGNGDPLYGYTTVTQDKLYDHPRVWVNPETLPTVIANLQVNENKEMYKKMSDLADLGYTGRLDSEMQGSFLARNFSVEKDVATIESLAFMYLTTGDELYGYTAIRAAKNFLDTVKTLPIAEKSSWTGDELYDISNKCSTAMGVMAEVYDWCYPLLTSYDKEFIVQAVLTKLAPTLEVANPPKNTGAVTGHSTSALSLRDWPSFAIAVADEYPEIYNHMLSVIEYYYMPAPNWYYKSGANFQGSAYGVNKSYLHMICEMLVLNATGVKLLDEDVTFLSTAYTYVHYLRPDGESLRLGDDYNQTGTTRYSIDIRMEVYGSFYYNDPMLKSWAMALTNDFKSISYGGMLETTPTKVLLLNDPYLEYDKDSRFDMPLINYNGSPTGALIARSAWNDADAWMVYMNIDEAYGANHDHKDAGTFQIYYKGILAPNTGAYQHYGNLYGQNYGSLFDFAYVKQTISKNGLLIYNPKYKDGVGAWKYSGGQTIQGSSNGENGTLEQWLAKTTSHQATELGHAWGYDEQGELVYSYISGDMTLAYDQDTVDLVMRSMISIATGNEAHPMMFIVYDRVASDDASFKKSYVLHTMENPTFVGDGAVATPDADYPNGIRTVSGTNVFYYTNTLGASGHYAADDPDDKYNGKLTHTTLLPENPTYRVIGGEGYRFWIDGTGNAGQAGDLTEKFVTELGWGRVEISPSVESSVDSFLNVMYVGDADKNDAYVPATLVKADTHEGAISFGSCVMFSKSNEAVTDAFSFTTEGDGEMTYYVTGLSHGLWEISVNGEVIDSVEVEKKNGLATFTAEAGEVTFTPKFGAIDFELNGGEFAKGTDVPDIYNFGEELELPDNLILDYFEFDGWYDNPDFNGKAITTLDGDDIGNITLYAKWRQVQAKLTLELNRGTYDGELPTRYNYYEALALPETLTKYGSTFGGWYFDADFSGERITEISENQKGDIILYAKWIKEFDVLAFELNGGEMEGDTSIKLPSEKYTLPTDVTKANCTFAGWYLDENLTERVTEITPDMGDIIVYAKWNILAEDSPASSLKPANSSAVTGKANLQYGDYIAESNGILTFVFKADKEGAGAQRNGVIRIRNRYLKNEVNILRFSGDDIKTSNNEIISSFADGDKIEVVMDFIQNKLHYVVNGEYVGNTSVSFNDDLTTYNFGTNDQTIGYLWQYNAGGNFKFDVQVWGGNTSFDSIAYELDNGVLPNGAPMQHFSSKTTVLPVPAKSGFTFLGWYDNPNFKGEPITEIAQGTSGDLKFYAKWQKDYSVVELHLDGGRVDGEFDAKITVGKEMILPTSVTKDGGIFLGWYADEALTQKITSVTPESDAENIHVYAKWISAYWSVGAGASLTEYYYENGDIGSDMIAAGVDTITLRIDTATAGNESWTAGTIRLRQGLAGKECHFVKFVDGNMMTNSGSAVLTSMNSGDVVDFVISFSAQTISYYVNGELKVTDTHNTIGTDLTYYNYKTSPVAGTPLDRGNMFQLTNAAPRKLAYDSVCIFFGNLYAE